MQTFDKLQTFDESDTLSRDEHVERYFGPRMGSFCDWRRDLWRSGCARRSTTWIQNRARRAERFCKRNVKPIDQTHSWGDALPRATPLRPRSRMFERANDLVDDRTASRKTAAVFNSCFSGRPLSTSHREAWRLALRHTRREKHT